MSKRKKPPGISEAILASVVDPRGTMHRLLVQSERPPYILATLLFFLIVCIAPVLLYRSYLGDALDAELIGCVSSTLALTFIITCCLVTSSAHAIGSNIYLRSLAALVYSLAPMTAIMGIMLLANRISQGSPTLVMFIALGTTQPNDLITEIFPYAFRASLGLAFLTLAYGLAAVMRGTLGIGLFMAALALILLLGSFVVGLTITDIIYPLTSSRTIDFFARYLAYPR